MTTAEACTLLIEQTRALSAARARCDAYRLVAQAALHYGTELTRELEMVSQRRQTYRRYTRELREHEEITT